ncbi:glycosyltransferase family 2 protein [Patescibacteria group bacterium]|nr:MAG: glycosyltransferase family 2 protein [Patescibacteria group bacterium]
MTIKEHHIMRVLEMIPGIAVWATFALALVGSVFFPLWVLGYILIYDLLWLFRVLRFVTNLCLAWSRFRLAGRTDWLAKVSVRPEFRDITHVVFLPTYKEEIGVIRGTLRSLAAMAYPKDRMIVVLAGEERDGDRFLTVAEKMQREFAGTFRSLLVTLHPADLPDEIPGKGSNLNWAGHEVRAHIDQLGIPYEKVIVSAFDVDTVAHPQYFAYLAETYLTTPHPTRASYQPIALYNNNIWEAKAPVRVAAFGTTFWLMNELVRQDRLLTFSSHSMSFRALVDVGYWQKDIVSEDSRISLQCITHYKGDYRIVPLYLPVSMDMVNGETYAQSLGALYRQIRRWAWGVEHFPWLVWNMGRDRATPLRVKAKYIFNALEGSYSWATAPILMFALGRLPFWIAAEGGVRGLAFFQNAPFTIEQIMLVTNIGVLVSAAMSLALLPPRPAHVPGHRWLTMVFQWLLLPITFVAFGSIPAVDAITRLMTGKKLGFNVTAKRRAAMPAAVPEAV